MAKKKVTTQINEPREQPQSQKDPDQDETISRQTSMEELGEKLQNLKSLNSLLAREVFEKRQQIDSLGQAKNALQRELARSKGDLEAELGRASDENAGLELEKLFFCVAMETYVREMCAGIDCLVREKEKREREIMLLKGEVNELMENFENEKDLSRRVILERDSVRSELDLQAQEVNGLREKVFIMEKKEKNLEERIELLEAENQALMERKKNNDNVIEAVTREKDKLERNLEEKLNEIQDLRGEIEEIAREKEMIQMENGEQKLTINDLEKELRTLNEILLNSRKEEEILKGKFLELEKSWGEGTEKQQDMAMEINALMEEKREMESSIEKLIEQTSCMTKELEMTKMESDEKARLIEDLSREKNELLKRREDNDNVVELVTGEKDKLEKNLEEKLKEMQDLQGKIEGIAREKEKIQMENGEQKLTINDLEKELRTLNEILLTSRKEEEILKGKVLELEKSWGEGTEKQQDMATEINALMEEKREMESRIKKLIEQTSCITKELEMTKMESDEKELLIEDLSREKNELLERKEDNDNVIELVRREKDKLEMNLEEKLKEIQDLHGEIEGIAREKEKIQMENDAQKLTINDLEKELRTLNEILLNSRKEEEMLSGKVFELEKSWGEGMEKQQDMTTEINALMEEKREMESCIAKLVEQMDCMTKDLEMTKTESDEKARLIEDLSREKNELEGLKLCTENEVAELHGEVGQLRDVVIRLQESCQNQEEQNKQLKSEVGHFKDAFDRVTIEKVDALKSVDEERKNGLKLMSEVSEVEKKIEETRNELARVKSEHDIVFEEKKGMERHFELLKKEKDSMQMKLSARVSEIEKSTEGTKKELARVRSECENLFGEKKELESRFELLPPFPFFFLTQPATQTSNMGKPVNDKHVLVIPFPAQGHMIPLLDLTQQLAISGLTITILVTPKNLPILSPLLASHSSIQTLLLPFPSHPSIPAGAENTKDMPATSFFTMMPVLGQLHDPLVHWFNTHPSPPCAVISDIFLGWTHRLATELGVRRFVFSPSGAFALSIIYSLWREMPKRTNHDNQTEVISFPKLPNAPKFNWRSVSTIYQSYVEGDPDSEFVKQGFWDDMASWGLVINTFTELEKVYLDHLRAELGHDRIWGVGPLHLLADESSSEPKQRGGASSVSVPELMTWLDSCEDRKVVYICFGSQAVLTNSQMAALASALEKSRVRFVWSVKNPTRGTGNSDKDGVIPVGFENRVEDRGRVIKGWAPQVSILNHRAVGAFLTHCGWNSVFEAVVAGVPMLAWPMRADQFSNATLLVDYFKVATKVCEGPQTVPDSTELARHFVELLSENRVEREKAMELRNAAVKAIKDGGSSARDLEKLVQQIEELEIQSN